jgi:hypothetical protein
MSPELEGELVLALGRAMWGNVLNDTLARIERVRELASSLHLVAPRTRWSIPSDVHVVVMFLRQQGLTDARAEATLAALVLGASFEQALTMLGVPE